MNAPAAATSATESVSARLEKISWDFRDARADRQSIHSFHAYPARFIPEIPRSIIAQLAPPLGTVVLDPFSGCGTTLVEAQHAQFRSVGVDLNPIGCLVARVKTSALPDGFLDEARNVVLAARFAPVPPIPDIPNVNHWFRRDVSEALAVLRVAIREVKCESTRQALEAVFSSIIVRVSNQDSDTRYAAVEKAVSADSVFGEFEKAAVGLARLATAERRESATILNRNIFDVKPADIGEEVGLVVTSPPYPNAYEYWLYHKYRMWWLEFDPLAMKEREIGARAHFFSGKRREQEDFLSQMTGVFQLLRDVLRRGCYCAFVVGDSKIHGEIIDNAAILERAARDCDFKLAFRADREINPYRKSFNLHHARIKREHVLVWER